MNKPIVSMFDRKAAYGAVSTVDNLELAKRQFAYAVNSEGIPSYAPADFELYHVGDFNDQTGRITPLDVPELVASGLDFIGRS